MRWWRRWWPMCPKATSIRRRNTCATAARCRCRRRRSRRCSRARRAVFITTAFATSCCSAITAATRAACNAWPTSSTALWGGPSSVIALNEYYDAAQAFDGMLAARGYTPQEIGRHAGLADTALAWAADASLVRPQALQPNRRRQRRPAARQRATRPRRHRTHRGRFGGRDPRPHRGHSAPSIDLKRIMKQGTTVNKPGMLATATLAAGAVLAVVVWLASPRAQAQAAGAPATAATSTAASAGASPLGHHGARHAAGGRCAQPVQRNRGRQVQRRRCRATSSAIYVPNLRSDDVYVIDPQEMKVVDRFKVGDRPAAHRAVVGPAHAVGHQQCRRHAPTAA